LDRLFISQEIDDFVALYQNPDTTESDIHRFLAANPKFLYLLGAYDKILSEVFLVTGDEVLGRSPLNGRKPGQTNMSVDSVDPERVISAKERLEQIRRMFARDATASNIVEFLGAGYTMGEIQSQLAIPSEKLTAVTRRIRRQLRTLL
jgi:hypothetical protein